jgi:hypothetical protein
VLSSNSPLREAALALEDSALTGGAGGFVSLFRFFPNFFLAVVVVMVVMLLLLLLLLLCDPLLPFELLFLLPESDDERDKELMVPRKSIGDDGVPSVYVESVLVSTHTAEFREGWATPSKQFKALISDKDPSPRSTTVSSFALRSVSLI